MANAIVVSIRHIHIPILVEGYTSHPAKSR